MASIGWGLRVVRGQKRIYKRVLRQNLRARHQAMVSQQFNANAQLTTPLQRLALG
jgi:hypothetical protein